MQKNGVFYFKLNTSVNGWEEKKNIFTEMFR